MFHMTYTESKNIPELEIVESNTLTSKLCTNVRQITAKKLDSWQNGLQTT